MEILVAPVENCLSNLIDDDACKVFSGGTPKFCVGHSQILCKVQ